MTLDEQTLRRFGRLRFAGRLPARAGVGGEHRSRAHAPSMEFAEHRAYRPGDDTRRVDWNVYGRLGTLQVKLTEARERREVFVIVDCSDSMRWGSPDKLAYAADAAVALAYVGLAAHDRVRLVRLGKSSSVLGPLQGRGQLFTLMRFAEDVAPSGPADLGTALAGCLALRQTRERRGSPLVVLLSDLLTADGLEAGIDALLAQGAELTVVHVLSPQEEAPDLEGELELLDVESGETLEVGLSAEVVALYRQRFLQWADGLASLCARRGVRYLRTGTSRPVEDLVLDDLRRVGLLR